MKELRKAERSTLGATERAPSRAVYRALFANSDLAFYVIAVRADGSFRFEDANAAVATFQIRPSEKIVGRTLAECLAPDIAECLEENLQLCLETGKVHSYDRTLDMPDGRMSWNTTLTPIVNRAGRIRHIVGITRDTSLEQRLLSAVGQSASMMEGMDATAPGLIYLFDLKTRSGRHVGGTNTLGYSPDELVNLGSRLISEKIHPDDLPKVERHLREMSRLGDGKVGSHEYRMRHKDGHYLHCLSRETVFSRDTAGEVELILGIAIDVSEQKEMEREVRELSEQLLTTRGDERRRIAQDLHDSTGQHLLAAELAVARIKAAYSRGALGNASRTMDEALVDAMSEIKEAEREIRVLSFLLHPHSIDSRGLSEALRSLVLGFGSRADIDIEAGIDPEADLLPEQVATSLYRVCQEALTNVHRHARATDVIVKLELSKASVSLTVADNGIGFDRRGRDPFQPTGLGLTGMRERIESLGGSVEIYRRDGTRVVATVPRTRVLASSGRSAHAA